MPNIHSGKIRITLSVPDMYTVLQMSHKSTLQAFENETKDSVSTGIVQATAAKARNVESRRRGNSCHRNETHAGWPRVSHC